MISAHNTNKWGLYNCAKECTFALSNSSFGCWKLKKLSDLRSRKFFKYEATKGRAKGQYFCYWLYKLAKHTSFNFFNFQASELAKVELVIKCRYEESEDV